VAAASRQICHWLSCGRVEPALRLRVRKSITQLEKHIHLCYITSLLLQFPSVTSKTSSARCVKLQTTIYTSFLLLAHSQTSQFDSARLNLFSFAFFITAFILGLLLILEVIRTCLAFSLASHNFFNFLVVKRSSLALHGPGLPRQ
jgi:hypothetical protein